MRDPAEFDAFYAASSPRLLAQVFAMTGDLGEAEDALQEAYIRAWQHWPRISGYAAPEGWVRSVAFKRCVNSWWKAKNRLAAHQRAADRRDGVDELGPDLLAVVQALRQVPEKQRHALVLHFWRISRWNRWRRNWRSQSGRSNPACPEGARPWRRWYPSSTKTRRTSTMPEQFDRLSDFVLRAGRFADPSVLRE